MGLQTIAPELYMTCPLDEAHRILKSRIQFHLVKCMKNHTLEKKMRCPWNPIHIVDRFEYLDHCNSKCEDLTNVMSSKILSEDDAKGDVGSIPVNATNALLPIDGEDWDASPCNYATYDPLKKSEGQPVLRSSIGLSKAKRKEFTLQERRRHQQLEDTLPIQIKSKPVQKINDIKPCRPPQRQSIAISANASMAEELNSSKFSDDGDRSVNFLANRRQPHGPCSAMAYEAVEDDDFPAYLSEFDRKVTLFDAEYDDGGENDARSCISSVSSRSSNIEAVRNFIKKQSDKGSIKSFASVASSSIAKKTSNIERVKVQEINLQDEAASFPSIVPTSVNDDDDDLEQLNQRLANLSSIEKSIVEEKEAIRRKMSKYDKKEIVNSESSTVANLVNGKDSNKSDVQMTAAVTTTTTTTTNNDSSVVNAKNCFTNVNRKCAANFVKSTKQQNPPTIGAGRGIVVDFEAYENLKTVGNRENQEETKENSDSPKKPVEKGTGSF